MLVSVSSVLEENQRKLREQEKSVRISNMISKLFGLLISLSILSFIICHYGLLDR